MVKIGPRLLLITAYVLSDYLKIMDLNDLEGQYALLLLNGAR